MRDATRRWGWLWLAVLWGCDGELRSAGIGEPAASAEAGGDACGALDFSGLCDGDVVRWCEKGVVQSLDCADWGSRCGWIDDDIGHYCVRDGGGLEGGPSEDGPEAAPPPPESAPEDEAPPIDDAPIDERGAPPPPEDEPPSEEAPGEEAPGEEAPGEEAPPPPDADEDEGAPPAPPEEGAPPRDDAQLCEGGLDYLGECRDQRAVWCDDGQVQEVDCGDRNQGCGWVNDQIGWFCGGASDAPGSPEEESPAPPPDDPAPPPGADDACGSEAERAVVDLANAARAAAGVGPLACDAILTQTARDHSQDMCDNGYFSHTGRDGSQPWDRVRRHGGQFRTAGENIAWGYQGPQAVHDGWMNSPGHRRNLLNGTFGRIGVGQVPCNGRPHWTQVFTD